MEKRWVLRRDWKTVRDSEALMSWGSAFQSLGAAREKALSPKLRSLDLGVERRSAEEDLRDREGW